MQKNTYFLSLFFLFVGFGAAYFIFVTPDDTVVISDRSTENTDYSKVDRLDNRLVNNPFSTDDGRSDSRLDEVENELASIKQELQRIDLEMQNVLAAVNLSVVNARRPHVDNRPASVLSRRLYKLEHLIKGGIDPSLAEEIVRKKNKNELKRLELQDLAKRKNYLNTQQYYDELEDINNSDVSLREELGDAQYDEYLFSSKQNNRIKIASVMLGSSAEQAGIQKNDVVLSYDNYRMFTWQELKNATTEGQLGDYVPISIYRNGEIYSFSVPRGPLGVQLGATRIPP